MKKQITARRRKAVVWWVMVVLLMLGAAYWASTHPDPDAPTIREPDWLRGMNPTY